ncbi:uncharacterized protein LY89DRAFT_786309 [Mollisia scopiformis]|uniref:Xylanolytic transcriptional activator regulatory domain-containing protein n=1 Tax=Mollisia scopiformis TaxID=149040 RepID=A0A194WW32_MOLSC|nr:uncharacterized protein LY89DRAFT_786309 [Mollisia scopiformis]KUJ12180.1 hypothetical protein LY89DRAFT_786309 [Mollisia scopiformis]
MNLSERVAQLEKELAALRADKDLTPRKNSFLADGKTNFDSSSQVVNAFSTSSEITGPISALSPTTANNPPILSLFDNAILNTSETNNAIYDSISREFGNGSLKPVNYQSTPHFRTSRIKRAKICEALTDRLPSQSSICEILEIGGIWWNLLRTLHPYMCCEDEKMSIQNYVFLALDQDNPCILGTALSWLVISMQCLPTSYDTSHLNLPMPLKDLTQHYVASIDQLIVCDDEISLSLEGIECILLQGQFYGDVGRPRKAWTIIRKALSHGVLLGLHKTTQVSANPSPHHQRRENVWWHMVQVDAYLSLMLGLQSFARPLLLDSQVELLPGPGIISFDLYRKKLFSVISKIGDRNQAMQISSNTTLTTTMEINQELDALSSHLQPISWNTTMPSQTESRKDTLGNYESIITNLWHYQAQSMLHLPFMLQSPSSGEFDCNRTVCISGSRKVVQVYIKMRELAGGRINLCRLVDFQVFMSVVIVLLGLLDWNLVYQTMAVLKVVSAEPENLIAAQCLQALETLVSIGDGQISSNGQASDRKIFIPYFGIINVAPVSSFMNGIAQATAPHLQEIDHPPATSSQANNLIIDIDVFNAFSFGNGLQNSGSVSRPEVPDDILLPDALTMDIDQDWSWMLNADYQMNGHM